MSSSEDPSSSSVKKEEDVETSQPEEKITFTVKSINDKKITTTVSPFISVADLKQKLAEEAEIPADRQRLIYSGHVLKDDRTIDSYKVKDGHTIHLVKGAASNATAATGNPSTGASATSGGASAGGPTGSPGAGGAARPAVPNMAAGTGSSPFSRLTNHIQLPSSSLFGPDGGMGAPPNPDEMLRMMDQPEFRATMNELLRNPTMLDHIIQSNPMLQQLGPNARQMMQTEEFRQMMTNPDLLRQMTSMQQMLGMGPFGGGAMGGAGGTGSFPAPGVTDQTPSGGGATSTAAGTNQPSTATSGENTNTTGTSQTGQPPNPYANPFAMLFNNPAGQNTGMGTQGAQAGSPPPAGGAPPNPFASLFSNPAFMNAAASAGAGAGARSPGQTAGSTETGGQQPPPANPFMPNIDYNQMMQMLQMFGGGGQGGFGGAGGPGAGGAAAAAANPPDSRPIEERYADQLRQLNDMGFFDFDRNCEALRRTGGSVQGAVEYLLSNS